MQLNKSNKIFNNYKCEYPQKTIERVEKGLKKIGFESTYKKQEIKSEYANSYYGELLIEKIGFNTCGKGVTEVLAKASAYAEMAERISSAFLVFHTITFNIKEFNDILLDVIERKFLEGFETNKDDLISCKKINTYLEKKINEKEFNVLKKQGLFDIIVDCYSISNEKTEKIPITFIEAISGSTGLAAGNTLEEAIVQGSCEIFERYTTYRILTERIECPTIDLDSIRDEEITDFIELFRSMNIELMLKDFSLNMGLPVIGVVFKNKNIVDEKNQLKKDLYYEMIDVGSHPDIKHAILRCFTERLQGVSKEEFMHRKKNDILYDFWTNKLGKRYVNHKELSKDFFLNYEKCGDISFLENGKKISIDSLSSFKSNDCLEECMLISDICKKNDLDLQVIDYTNKKLGFPTVRVIIPPFSTSHDPFMLSSLIIPDDIKRFNSLYEIKDFYNFVISDDWLNDKEKIKRLKKYLEDFLSKNINSYRRRIRQSHFLYPINLFEILALLNLSLKNFKQAKEYFEVLIKINDKPSYYSEHYNDLLNPGFNPNVFLNYKNKIEECLKEGTSFDFELENNPFRPKNRLYKYEKDFENILNNLRNSYF